ncbi:MAG: hypothetical protein GXP31_06175 [Kiritimatiellaeota bacterium]|nr:hypothetical protein [Kiritimatiellota bacterium]
MATRSQFKGLSLGMWALFLITAAVGVLGLAVVGRAGNTALEQTGRRWLLLSEMSAALSSLRDAAMSGAEIPRNGTGVEQETVRSAAEEQFERALAAFAETGPTAGVADALSRLGSAWGGWRRVEDAGAVGADRTVRAAALDRVQSSLRGLVASVEQAILLQVRELSRATQAWSLGLAFAAFAGLLAAALLGRYLDGVLVRPLGRICDLLGRANVGETYLRVPVQRDPLLRTLGRRCNQVLENLERTTEESRRRIKAERTLAAAVAESCDTPVLILNPAGELLLCNGLARELVAGEVGRALLGQLKEAVHGDKTTVAARGKVYRVVKSEAAAVRGFAGWVVHLPSAPDGGGEDES